MSSPRVIVEADGGSRGNPGPAAFGALLRDAATGEVIAEAAETIGIATNNVAEYRGLIAGLALVREHAADAVVEVRMDSKLVVEQMAGRWKIKHDDMRRLAAEARELAGADTTWTWVPRAENAVADALANAALDGELEPIDTAAEDRPSDSGWGGGSASSATTTFVLIRHGATPLTERKVFSGSGGDDPSLSELGLAQAERAAVHARTAYELDAVVTSPLARARETAEVIADGLGLDLDVDDRLREMDFGDWEGFTFGEIGRRWPDQLKTWMASSAIAPPGGESFDAVYARSVEARDALIEGHRGQTVGVVSHVGVIKMMMVAALQTSVDVAYRLELAPASFTTVRWSADGHASLREFSVVPR